MFNNGQDADDLLQGAAADYSLAIDEANERLRQCGGLLRKGLRCEAIQLCEIEPNLLEVVEILDFPERDTWNELLALHGLAAPPMLMLDAAANLNEAYAIEQPLATLMQRHRLLAMSHGPIKLRVETLRCLADADPENAIWDQDVRTFEAERVKELQREVPQAIAGGDVTVLDALADELKNSAWRVDRPDALLQQIGVARAKAARQQGLDELQRAADELNAMHAEFDVDGGRLARWQWDTLYATWGEFASPSLPQEVAAALDWSREQEELAEQAARHEAAVAALQKAIAARGPAEELHRLHRDAKGEGEIPANVEKRYRDRLEAIDRAARRKMHVSLAIFASFILVVGAIVAWQVIEYLRKSAEEAKLRGALASLKQFRQENDFDNAKNLIGELKVTAPQIADDADIQECNRWATEQIKARDEKRGTLAGKMEFVEKAIQEKHPNNEAELYLTDLATLGSTDDERDAVRKLKQKYADMKRDKQAEIDRVFLVELKKLDEQIGAIEKAVKDKPGAGIDKIRVADLTDELNKLLQRNPQISEAMQDQAESRRDRLKKLDDKRVTADKQLTREEAITAACGDKAAFQKALSEYADKFPQEPCSARFRTVANDEASLWDWVGQWNEIVKTIGRQNCAKFDRKTAADAVSKLRKMLEDRPGRRDAEAFKQRLPYLEAIVRRIDAEGNPIEAALKPVFTDPLVTNIWMLSSTAGQKYYLLEDSANRLGPFNALTPEGTYGFDYVAGFDLTRTRKSLRGKEIASLTAAPQCATARALATTLEGTTDESWEPSFCRMIETVVNDKDSDALLRHFLLRKILAVGCQGSLCLQKAFSGSMDVLDNSKVPASVNWVDPNDPGAAVQRPVAEAELAKLPKFTDAKARADQQRESLGKAIGTELIWVGWLRKNAEGKWQCLVKANCSESGRLGIVRAAGAKDDKAQAAVFEPVGRLEPGKAAIDDAVPASALAEGRPVFVAKPPPR